MTAAEFVKVVEAYYGSYRPAVSKAVLDYVAPMPDSFRRELWQAIKLGHEYNTPPNVAIIARYRREVRESRELAEDASRYIEELPMDSETVGEFMSGLLQSMRRGVHPSEYYERWQQRGE